MMMRALSTLAVLAALAQPASACRQALALALDVSGSVDSREYRLQLDGLAAALEHPEVVRSILSPGSPPVRLAIYEWSAPSFQRMLRNWTEIRAPEDLAGIANSLRGTRRAAARPHTGLGTALRFGAALLRDQAGCWKRTLDVSGDGRNNLGPHPRDLRAVLARDGVTVNALVIGNRDEGSRHAEIGALTAYFTAYVLTGPDAFVEAALGFESYEDAMIRKLLRELQAPALSRLEPWPEQGD